VKVVFATPSLAGPRPEYIAALEASVPVLDAAGIEHGLTQVLGNPYISGARAELLTKAMNAGADIVVYLDYDLSWRPADLLTLIETPGDVVAGTYRFKKDNEEYMGGWHVHADNRPVLRPDGCFKANRVPAGFLKITRQAVDWFAKAYPHLTFGDDRKSVDLFNHGALDGVWMGEDYAFSRRWEDMGEELWIVPDLDLTHHGDKPYLGNLHRFMMRQPGGCEA